jgi:pyrimidine operon attenuation protein/uracil phosphoribosyltransferase
VGIRKGGVELADRLQHRVVAPRRPLRGNVDITLDRDDLYTGLEKPVLGDTDLPFSVDGCDVVLVDDVLYTGRTVRAAMDEILDYGRPARIRLAVLVDRGHHELPIAADHVGLRLETAQADRVQVALGAKNRNEEDHIWLKRR